MPAFDVHAHARRRRGGAILTAALAFLASAALPCGAAASPQLVAEQPLFDVGTVVKGEDPSHTFVLRNPGKTPIAITHVLPGTGVRVVSFDATIPAGGEGRVVAALDTATVTGQAKVSLGVFVAGGSEPAVILSLQSNVVSKLLTHPGYARWIFVQHEREGTIGQTIYAGDGADFEVAGVESPAPAIRTSYREAKPEERVAEHPGRQWRVESTLASDAPVGALAGFLTVRTTHPQQKTLWIPVSGFVRPMLFVDPPRGDVGTLTPGRKRATYTVRNFATAPIGLTGAATDLAGVTARVEPLEAGRRWRVVVEFDPAAMAAGPFAGQLRLTTDNEKVPLLTVDLSGTIARPQTD